MTKKLISIESARQQLIDGVSTIKATETLPLMQAFGRVLAQPYQAGINVPPADNSAMDGYAVNSMGLQVGSSLPISQRIAAGEVAQPLLAGTAARIFTGAEIPVGADAVIIQEDCRVEGDRVTLLAPVKPWENIRPQGQDIHAGTRLLEKGHYLGAADVALLASVNIAEVVVYRTLRVALLSTGDELLDPGQPQAPGKIYNSNRYLLTGLLRDLGCDVVDLGIVADTLDATKAALQQAAEADVILSSGGVSVGEEDHVKAAVTELGKLKLWKINLKPGKPLAFGYVGETPFVGLPGNPVSAFVTFTLLVRALLFKRQGRSYVSPQPLRLPALFALPNPRKRCEYLRGRITPAGVEIYPQQSSGALSSVVWANCLVRIDVGVSVAEGDEVQVYPL